MLSQEGQVCTLAFLLKPKTNPKEAVRKAGGR